MLLPLLVLSVKYWRVSLLWAAVGRSSYGFRSTWMILETHRWGLEGCLIALEIARHCRWGGPRSSSEGQDHTDQQRRRQAKVFALSVVDFWSKQLLILNNFYKILKLSSICLYHWHFYRSWLPDSHSSEEQCLKISWREKDTYVVSYFEFQVGT